ETLKEEKEGVDGKLAGLLKASKDLGSLIESQRNFPPVNRKFSPGSRNFPSANRKFPTASRKFPTGSTKCSTADMVMKGKAVILSKTYPFWEESRLEQEGEEQHFPVSSSSTTTTDTTSDESGSKSRRTVTLTAKYMQKKKNDVKARTTLLLSLSDEHQLRFIKYKTARELWSAILKTFSGNEATKKTKKNLLKQQYGNFKAEGSKTLEQTFNRLQVIVGQL
nr:hypothetical protein [Tanacetum cinerariifolium]